MNRPIVIVPIGRYIEPGCDEALRELSKRGYDVRREYGIADIARGRSILASEAIASGYSEIIWIDSDMIFAPDDLDKLRSHNLPLVGAVGAKKGVKDLACKFLPTEQEVTFGPNGGLMEVAYLGTGFLLTRSEVYRDMAMQFKLPCCWHKDGKVDLYPFFHHIFVESGENLLYLSEDFSFCERARRCGYKVMLDTSIRLGHIGQYPYSWEDLTPEKQRYGGLVLTIKHE